MIVHELQVNPYHFPMVDIQVLLALSSRMLQSVAVIICLMALSACNVPEAKTEIASLKGDLARVDQQVAVHGQVIRRVPLLGIFAYELQDQTGRIWVLTAESNWALGAEVTTQGKLYLKQHRTAGTMLEEFYVDTLAPPTF